MASSARARANLYDENQAYTMEKPCSFCRVILYASDRRGQGHLLGICELLHVTHMKPHGAHGTEAVRTTRIPCSLNVV